jgi:neutral ceramidase
MSLTAGTAIADISPKQGLELGGYPHYPRHNTGIHDPLYASCLYMDNGKEKMAVVAMDLLFYSKQHVQKVRKRIEKETGIPAGNIMFSCSHTHSGPWASGRLDLDSLLSGVKQDEAYTGELNDKLAKLVSEAVQSAFPAEIGITKGYCGKEQGVGGNRRDPGGVCDTDVCILAVKEKKGDIRGVYINYALHPTVIHAESTVVTADYPAYIRTKLKEMIPSANLLFAQGASGNQSTRYFRNGQSFDEAKRIGEAIAVSAMDAIRKLDYSDDISLSATVWDIPIELRTLPPRAEMERRVRELKKRYDELVQTGASYIETQNADLKLLGAEDMLGYIIMFESGKTMELITEESPAEIQILKIGGLNMVGLPGEWFVEYALSVKRGAAAPYTFVNTVTNGCLPGYVYTQEALKEGGYETDTSLLHEGFGNKVIDQVIGILGKADF